MMSPGWQSSSRHTASNVDRRTADTRTLARIRRGAGLPWANELNGGDNTNSTSITVLLITAIAVGIGMYALMQRLQARDSAVDDSAGPGQR